jgi:hypothetical protein
MTDTSIFCSASLQTWRAGYNTSKWDAHDRIEDGFFFICIREYSVHNLSTRYYPLAAPASAR